MSMEHDSIFYLWWYLSSIPYTFHCGDLVLLELNLFLNICSGGYFKKDFFLDFSSSKLIIIVYLKKKNNYCFVCVHFVMCNLPELAHQFSQLFGGMLVFFYIQLHAISKRDDFSFPIHCHFIAFSLISLVNTSSTI